MTTVDTSPYYVVSAETLATWLEDHAAEAYWSVDGDNLLTSRLDFPCPTEELVTELRRLGGEMLVHAPQGESAKGAPIEEDGLERIVIRESSAAGDDGEPSRTLYLRWKGQDSSEEWVLFEDVA